MAYNLRGGIFRAPPVRAHRENPECTPTLWDAAARFERAAARGSGFNQPSVYTKADRLSTLSMVMATQGTSCFSPTPSRVAPLLLM